MNEAPQSQDEKLDLGFGKLKKQMQHMSTFKRRVTMTFVVLALSLFVLMLVGGIFGAMHDSMKTGATSIDVALVLAIPIGCIAAIIWISRRNRSKASHRAAPALPMTGGLNAGQRGVEPKPPAETRWEFVRDAKTGRVCRFICELDGQSHTIELSANWENLTPIQQFLSIITRLHQEARVIFPKHLLDKLTESIQELHARPGVQTTAAPSPEAEAQQDLLRNCCDPSTHEKKIAQGNRSVQGELALPSPEKLKGFEFDVSRFRRICLDGGKDSTLVEKKLQQLRQEPHELPEMALDMVLATPSGPLLLAIKRKASDFTDFCGLLARDTICPPEYFAEFWMILNERDAK